MSEEVGVESLSGEVELSDAPGPAGLAPGECTPWNRPTLPPGPTVPSATIWTPWNPSGPSLRKAASTPHQYSRRLRRARLRLQPRADARCHRGVPGGGSGKHRVRVCFALVPWFSAATLRRPREDITETELIAYPEFVVGGDGAAEFQASSLLADLGGSTVTSMERGGRPRLLKAPL